MKILMQTYWDTVHRSVFIASMLCTVVILLNACTPVISPQLMEQVDQNLTYGSLIKPPGRSQG